MADLEQLNSLLVRLSEQTSPGGSFQGEPVSAEELEAARACLQLLDRSDDAVVAEFWQGCSAAGASFTSVAKSIGHLLRAGGDAAVLAATLYATLLRTKGSPVGRVCRGPRSGKRAWDARHHAELASIITDLPSCNHAHAGVQPV